MRWNMIKNILPESNSETTKELRYFIDQGACLFDPKDPYPIWKEDHRPVLEKKIKDHYLMQQIGFETFGRFKHELNTRMREIMPYYIELYKTTLFEYNPIENYSMREEFFDESKNKGKTNASSLDKHNDTPMTELADLKDHLNHHLTAATQNDSEASSEATNDSKHSGWRKGNIGVTTSQQMIQAERDIIINIDKMIIDELQDLFLGVF